MESRTKQLRGLGFTSQRQAVCRMHLQGKTHEVIASRLGICKQRVSQHLAAAVARFPMLAEKGLIRIRVRRRSAA